MSVIVGEAIQRVQSLYSKGVQSKDTRLTPRHIYSALKTSRSTVVGQLYNKKQKINDEFYQVLPAIELVKATLADAKISSNQYLRTKFKLPTFISGIDKDLIRSFTTLEGDVAFDRDDFITVKRVNGNKYTAENPRYFFRNSYSYITVIKSMKGASMEALFDDPIEAQNYPNLLGCTDCDCIPYTDYDFHIDGKNFDTIVKLSVNELVIMFSQMKEDKTPNANDDNAIGGQMIHQPNNPQQDD